MADALLNEPWPESPEPRMRTADVGISSFEWTGLSTGLTPEKETQELASALLAKHHAHLLDDTRHSLESCDRLLSPLFFHQDMRSFLLGQRHALDYAFRVSEVQGGNPRALRTPRAILVRSSSGLVGPSPPAAAARDRLRSLDCAKPLIASL